MTQKDRVLKALERSGAFGVTTVDAASGVLGEPILRLAARIDELRQEGHVIKTVTLKNRTARYVLVKASQSRTGGEVVESPAISDGGLADSPSEALWSELEWV